jgi:hypothetical protein
MKANDLNHFALFSHSRIEKFTVIEQALESVSEF